MTVMDMCCGKGGDLKKFHVQHVAAYYGVDIAGRAIDLARQRVKRTLNGNPRYMLYTADCFGDRLLDILPIGPSSMDLISCQFSLHYAFESEARARQMLQNVASLLKVRCRSRQRCSGAR